MSEQENPKVFISYSWSNSDFARELAEKLTNDGIVVCFDQWDLRPGQDKYVFMESCVNNPEITKVLILCDRIYAEKANNREGGVGDETLIISSEVYEKTGQRKFIPVIIEKDEAENAYVPVYIKSRIYIDLSDGKIYGEEYEKLVRDIYEKPLYERPPLGQRPSFLDEEKANLFPLKEVIRQIKKSKTENQRRNLIAQFHSIYVETLKTFFIKSPTGEQAFQAFLDMKPVRDVFLEFIEAIVELDFDYAEYIAELFEKLYNEISDIHTFLQNTLQFSTSATDIFKIHIWELFVCVIAYLRHIADYGAIYTLLTYPYYLNIHSDGDTKRYENYTRFRFYSRLIEEDYKLTTEYRDHFTILGKTICSQREKLPIYSRAAMAESDLFLYHVCKAYDLVDNGNPYFRKNWFPTMYVYAEGKNLGWERLQSERFCKKIFPLFGVNSVAKLKDVISRCTFDNNVCYTGCHEPASTILNFIKVEEIGTIN